MDCSRDIEWADAEYLARFRRKAIANRVPLTGSIDLTWRCNLNCVHCYIDKHDATSEPGTGELDTRQWLRIIDEIAAAGCLYLLITGGDPLLRTDFLDIYLHAKKRGLLITVFTNGTTLSAEILAAWQHFPPRLVEITLYGATEETYRAITGSGSGLAACLRTIRRLTAGGIPVGLKTMLMALNRAEFDKIEQIAVDLDLPFRYDAAIFPRRNGDRSVTRLRIDPDEVARIDFASPARAREWAATYQRMRPGSGDGRLYCCGSGKTTFHITAGGMLQPCLMCGAVQFNLREGSFLDGWRQALPAIDDLMAPADSDCILCDRKILCGYCPPFSALENGRADSVTEYLCQLGTYRYQHLVEYLEKNENTEIIA